MMHLWCLTSMACEQIGWCWSSHPSKQASKSKQLWARDHLNRWESVSCKKDWLGMLDHSQKSQPCLAWWQHDDCWMKEVQIMQCADQTCWKFEQMPQHQWWQMLMWCQWVLTSLFRCFSQCMHTCSWCVMLILQQCQFAFSLTKIFLITEMQWSMN